ncbi:MAG: radical SAM protein [Chloroflexota bacterium]|nr:radical SAM protein [Chloroflexota bacterium]
MDAMMPAKLWKAPYYLHLSKVPTAPLYVDVEPTNGCNLRCTICSMDESRARGLMSLDLFRRIVDQCVEAGVPHISLFLSGEPTVHPKLTEMVAIAEAAGIESGFHTNGMLLNEERSRALIEAGLSQISFSIDGEDKETYESIRVRGKWERLLGNVERFLELKVERGTGKPWVTIQIIKMWRPEYSAGRKLTLYPEVAPHFKARFAHLPVDEWKVVLPHTWAGEMPDIQSKPKGSVYYPCQHLWMGLSIAWDGRVLMCCNDLNGKYVRGDVKQHTIKEIWNDRQSTYLRQLHRRKGYQSLPLCRDCDQVWQEEHPLRSELRQLPLLQPAIRAYRAVRGTAAPQEAQAPAAPPSVP